MNGMKYFKMKLSMENLGVLKWYVDSSHNVHAVCKGHGGAMFTIGETSNNKLIKKSEIEYAKLNRDGAFDGRHVHARNVVVTAFHTKSRDTRQSVWNVSG